MFIPTRFQNTDIAEVKDFIRQNSFGILVSHTGEKLWGTHVPLELSDDEMTLQGHISRANPQWQYFQNNQEVMAIFNGPHTYISSSWYDHENVPTWNYIAVHVYGKVKILEGEALYRALEKLVDKYEQQSEKPVRLKSMSNDYVERSIRGIVGVEITISSIEAAYKLSQNRDSKNHSNIIEQLRLRGDAQSIAIADAMHQRIEKTS